MLHRLGSLLLLEWLLKLRLDKARLLRLSGFEELLRGRGIGLHLSSLLGLDKRWVEDGEFNGTLSTEVLVVNLLLLAVNSRMHWVHQAELMLTMHFSLPVVVASWVLESPLQRLLLLLLILSLSGDRAELAFLSSVKGERIVGLGHSSG